VRKKTDTSGVVRVASFPRKGRVWGRGLWVESTQCIAIWEKLQRPRTTPQQGDGSQKNRKERGPRGGFWAPFLTEVRLRSHNPEIERRKFNGKQAYFTIVCEKKVGLKRMKVGGYIWG